MANLGGDAAGTERGVYDGKQGQKQQQHHIPWGSLYLLQRDLFPKSFCGGGSYSEGREHYNCSRNNYNLVLHGIHYPWGVDDARAAVEEGRWENEGRR